MADGGSVSTQIQGFCVQTYVRQVDHRIYKNACFVSCWYPDPQNHEQEKCGEEETEQIHNVCTGLSL